jgi:K+-transporting ATPase KdpF subunit
LTARIKDERDKHDKGEGSSGHPIGFFCGDDRIRVGMYAAEIRSVEMLGNILLLGISALLLVYLLAALVWPERF